MTPGNSANNPKHVKLSTQSNELVQIDGITPVKDFVPSRFNARTSSPDGTLVLYNSLTGGISGFPPKLRTEVEEKLHKTGFSGRVEGLTKYLHDRGFLVVRGTNELQRMRLLYGQQQYRPDRLELILLASEECNFRCVYCYETFPRETMEPWVRKAIVQLVERRAGVLNSLSIAWFGGEPLLGFEAIAELGPTFLKIAEQHGFAYSSNMTTNGYLLTPDIFEKLLRWNIRSYQITIDGTPEDHDKHRVLQDGGPTFQVIFDNLQEMQKSPERFKVSLRVNFDRDNLPRMPEFMDLLKQRFGSDERFLLRFYPIGQWGGKNDDKLAVCGQGAEDERQALEIEATRKGIKAESKFIFMQPRTEAGVCYAARPYNLLIGADGKIMKCTIALDTKDYNIVGHLTRDGRADIDVDKFARWVAPYFEDDPNCRKCFYVPVCQGCSCPLRIIESASRPCPPEKGKIRTTLQTVWLTQQDSANRYSVTDQRLLPR